MFSTPVSVTDAHANCEADFYNGNKGYLVTINNKQEYDLIMYNYFNSISAKGANFWISGVSSTSELSIFNYSSGPEANSLLYNFYTETCNQFCDWSSIEPNTLVDEIYIHYDPSTNKWNNKGASGTSVNRFQYICEYGGMISDSTSTAYALPVSTDGGTIKLKGSSWLSTGYTLNFTRYDDLTGNLAFQITEVNIEEAYSVLSATLPPGTGQWNISISTVTPVEVIASNIPFQYLAPHVSLLYPATKGGASVTLIGENFGANPSKISISFNSVQCGSILLISPSMLQCTLQSDIPISQKSAVYPLRIKVDGLLTTHYKTPFYYKQGTFIQCWGGSIDPKTKFNIASNLVYQNMPGYLTYVDSQYLAQLLYSICARRNDTTKLTLQTSISWIQSSRKFVNSESGQTAINVYNPRVLFSSEEEISYDVINQYHDAPLLSGYGMLGALTFPNAPAFIDRYIELPTSGGLVQLNFTDYFGGPGLNSTITYLNTSQPFTVVNGTEFHTNFNFPAGYGGPQNLTVQMNSPTLGTFRDFIPVLYSPPLIQFVTNVSRNGGWITINGTNFYNDISKVTIYGFTYDENLNMPVDEMLPCISGKFLVDHQVITCNLGKISNSAVALLVSLLLGDASSNSYPVFLGMPPQVQSVSPPGRRNQNVWYTINGANFQNYSISVTIGGKSCSEIRFIDFNTLMCLFDGSVPQVDPNQNLFVNVTCNQRYGGGFYFYYNPDLRCATQCIHGKCDNQTGECQCDTNWTGSTCNTPVNNGGKPTENNGTITNPAYVNFTTSITHLREVDSTSNYIKTIEFSKIKWIRENVTNNLIGRFDNESVIVNVRLTIYENETTINFAGQDIVIPANSAKYLVKISNWTFSDALSTLQVVYMSSTVKSSRVGCSDSDTLLTEMGSDSYLIEAGNSILRAKFASYLYVDNRITKSVRQTLKDDDPIVKSNSNPNRFTMATAIIVPHFQQSTLIDPSFTALIRDGGNKDCEEAKWRLPTIIACSIAGGIALVVGITLLIRSNIMRRKLKNHIKMKQRELM